MNNLSEEKTHHLQQLLFDDEIRCQGHLKALEISNYCPTVKNTIQGYFRERSTLNNTILNESDFFQEKNIGLENEKEAIHVE